MSARPWSSASLLLLLVAGLGSSCRTFTQPDAPATSATKLVGGTEALDHEYPAVLIWTTGDEGLTKSYCSGTKIGPRLLLTAAHCVLLQNAGPDDDLPYGGRWQRLPAMEPGRELKYSRERRLMGQSPHHRTKITRLHLPPALEACLAAEALLPECTGRAPQPDVAVIQVEPEAESPFAAMPAWPVEFARVEIGQRVTVMGYGKTDDVTLHLPRLKYHRSEVASPSSLTQSLVGTEAERDGVPDLRLFFGTLGILQGTIYANLGSGDSGGPVVREAPNGPVVVGVNSDGFCPLGEPTCERTTNSFFQRLDLGATHGVGEWLSDLL